MYKYCCRHWVSGVVLLAAIPGIHLVFSQSRVHFLHPHQRMAELLEHTQSKSPVVNATSTKKTSLIGVPNFGQVTPTLYRGGQPTLEGLRQLRALGVEIVINLRNEQNEIETERLKLKNGACNILVCHGMPHTHPTAERSGVSWSLYRRIRARRSSFIAGLAVTGLG